MIETLLPIMPPPLSGILQKIPEWASEQLEEIRVRERRPLEIQYGGQFGFVSIDGMISADPQFGYRPSRGVCAKLLDLATNHSLYTFEEELRRGYITIAGGHRIGLSGRAVLEHGAVRHLRDIAGFNIRIARQVFSAADRILPLLLDWKDARVHHTLVISPPQQGKTTLLRELARRISSGLWNHPDANWPAQKVGIVDERSELAACLGGVPSFDVGPRTDVLDRCPKAEGMMMMIRAMSPDVLIVDEIGRAEDAAAVREALHAGIRVIASAHGQDVADVRQRPMLADLLQEPIFSRYVILNRANGREPRLTVVDSTGNTVGGGTAVPR